jgi:rubrerythrin
MRTTAKERAEVIHRLGQLGIDYQTAESLRRISMTLHRWFEGECGTTSGCIERDEETGKTYWLNSNTGRRFKIADRETGAKKRLAKLMEGLKNRCDRCGYVGLCDTCPECIKITHPYLTAYIQGDCRGASLYLLRKGVDLKPGESIDSVYSRGVAVY